MRACSGMVTKFCEVITNLCIKFVCQNSVIPHYSEATMKWSFLHFSVFGAYLQETLALKDFFGRQEILF